MNWNKTLRLEISESLLNQRYLIENVSRCSHHCQIRRSLTFFSLRAFRSFQEHERMIESSDSSEIRLDIGSNIKKILKLILKHCDSWMNSKKEK